MSVDPTTRAADAPANPTANRILIAVGVSLASLAALIASAFVPQFADVHQNFGTELSAMTRTIGRWYPALWALPVLTLIVGLAWPRPERRGLYACLLGGVGLFVLLPLIAAAMYLPIFELAKDVGF